MVSLVRYNIWNPKETFIISCTPKQCLFQDLEKNYKKLTQDKDKNYVGSWYFSNEFKGNEYHERS